MLSISFAHLRVDVFRTHPKVLSRASPVLTEFGTVSVLSLEDLAARATRLTLPLLAGRHVPWKHASDLLRLLRVVDEEVVERSWPEHRKAGDPEGFRDTATLLRERIPQSPELLTRPAYSQDVSQDCPRCALVEGLELANRETVQAILGYC